MDSLLCLPPSATPVDIIIINNLVIRVEVGPDRWGKKRAQPIRVSLHAHVPLAAAGQSDDVSDTLDYGALCKLLVKALDGEGGYDMCRLGADVVVLALQEGARAIQVVLEAPNQFVTAESAGISAGTTTSRDRVYFQAFIKNIAVNIILGVNPPEREWKQAVTVDIVFHAIKESPPWQDIYSRLMPVSPPTVSVKT
jgi:FolB domain-containing protein